MALNINQTQLDSFNKTVNKGHGTLISNWHEEAHLREETGDGRNQHLQHIPKKHHELFHLSPNEIPLFKQVLENRVDTTTRLFGKITPDVPPPQSKIYGTTRNPADSIPKVGRRQQLIEQQFLKHIEDEIQSQETQSFQQTQVRNFSTTNRVEFYKKDPIEAGNTLGKRVMKTQNGAPVQGRDVDLLTDHGFYQKPPISNEEDLKKLLKQESYLNAQPITFYTEKLNHGAFYGSKPVCEERPFHKTDNFAKQYHHFTHIKN